MSTQITVNTRPIGYEDIAFDVAGAGVRGEFVTPSGVTLKYQFINASHIPLTSTIRADMDGATNVNDALSALAAKIGNISSVTAMTEDKTVTLGSGESESTWNTNINNQTKNLGGHTLTIVIPASNDKALTESLLFKGFYNGKLIVNLNDNTLSDAASLEELIKFFNCGADVELYGGTTNGKLNHSTHNTPCAVRAVSCNGINVSNITFTGDNSDESFAMYGQNSIFFDGGTSQGVTYVNDKVFHQLSLVQNDAPGLIASHNSDDNAHSAKFSLFAPLASPTFTGVPKAPTAESGTNNTQLATTAFVTTAISSKAPLASPVFTGVPEAPTSNTHLGSNQIATTLYVSGWMGEHISDLNAHPVYAKSYSPTFIGEPKAPTPATGDNSTKIATTAYVVAMTGGAAAVADAVIETGSNANGWFRVWRSGWVEQGGIMNPVLSGGSIEEGYQTIVFPKSFSNTNYCITGSIETSSAENGGGGFEVSNLSTTGCRAYLHDGGNNAKYKAGFRWYACGTKG